MAKYIKGSISYIPVVDQINRKFTPRKNTCSLGVLGLDAPIKIQPAKYMGGGTRVTGRGGGIGTVSKNFMFFRENPRITGPSSDELSNRLLFTQARAGAQHIIEDFSQLDRVQTMWVGGTFGGTTYVGAKNDPNVQINGVRGYGYTFKGWIFAVQHAGKKEDSSYDVNTFPSAYDA